MRSVACLLTVSFWCVISHVNAVTTVVAGRLEGNVTWNRESGDILVDGELEIPQGSSLTIRAGAHVRFAPDATITNNGLLRVVGSKEEWVVLEPERGSWKGITFGRKAVTATTISSSDSDSASSSPSYVDGSLLQRVVLRNLVGGVEGALRCPHGATPYLHHVVMENVTGRAMSVQFVPKDTMFVSRNVTVVRRAESKYQRSDVDIRGGGRFWQHGQKRRYRTFQGRVWMEDWNILGSTGNPRFFLAPFALVVAGLQSVVLRNSRLEGRGSGMECFDTESLLVRDNVINSCGGNSLSLWWNRVGKPFVPNDIVVLENNMLNYISSIQGPREGGMTLIKVDALRMAGNVIRRGGFARIVQGRGPTVIRNNRWTKPRGSASLLTLGVFNARASLSFIENEITNGDAPQSILSLVRREEQSGEPVGTLEVRRNVFTKCTAGFSLLAIADEAWTVTRNIFEDVSTPLSVDVSGVPGNLDPDAPYQGVADNYWGPTFQEDIVTGRRRTVRDGLSDTGNIGTVVDFVSVLTEPSRKNSAEKQPVNFFLGSLKHPNGVSWGGIVTNGSHVIDVDEEPTMPVNFNLILAGNSKLRIIGGKKGNVLRFRRGVGIIVLDKAKLNIGTKDEDVPLLQLVVNSERAEANWGRILLLTRAAAQFSRTHFRDSGGIFHKGSGDLTIDSVRMNQSARPGESVDGELTPCLDSVWFGVKTEGILVRISNSVFENCGDAILFSDREDVSISNSSFSISHSSSFFGAINVRGARRRFEMQDSVVSHSHVGSFPRFSSTIQFQHESELASEMVLVNNTINSKDSSAVIIETCFSSILVEKNTISFRDHAIKYIFLVSDCDAKKIAIRNNKFVDSHDVSSVIWIEYEPPKPGGSLVIDGNAFSNVTARQMIRADVLDAKGNSVVITGNFFDHDCVATGHGPSRAALIYLTPFECPGKTKRDPSLITCSAGENIFVDREISDENRYYFLSVGLGRKASSASVVNATHSYWGSADEAVVRSRIFVVEGYRNPTPVESLSPLEYLPYRQSAEVDAASFPSCANSNRCSGRGLCVDESECNCWPGWTGEVCQSPAEN